MANSGGAAKCGCKRLIDRVVVEAGVARHVPLCRDLKRKVPAGIAAALSLVDCGAPCPAM